MTKLTQRRGENQDTALTFSPLISLLCFKALVLQSSQHAAVQGVGEPWL